MTPTNKPTPPTHAAKPGETTAERIEREKATSPDEKARIAREQAEKQKAEDLAKEKPPGEVKIDAEKLDRLVNEKIIAGLSYEMAVEAAKRQLEEDARGDFQKTRDNLNRPAAGQGHAERP
jgi:hypothetical protein